MLPSGAKLILTNLPNRLELLFRCVCALPNASRMGLAWRIWRSRRPKRPFAVNDKLLDPGAGLANCLRWKELVRGKPEDIGL